MNDSLFEMIENQQKKASDRGLSGYKDIGLFDCVFKGDVGAKWLCPYCKKPMEYKVVDKGKDVYEECYSCDECDVKAHVVTSLCRTKYNRRLFASAPWSFLW